MKVCILYDSKYGNGKTCMEFLGSFIKDSDHEVEIYSVKEIEPSSIPEADVFIFSAPTHFGNVSGKMKEFIKKIDNKEGKRYSVITTCLEHGKSDTTDTMEKILEEKGMKKAAKSVKIKVKGMKGPVDNNSEKQLKNLANELMEEIA